MSDGGDEGSGLGTGGGRSRFSLPPPPAASFGREASELPPPTLHRRLPSYVSEPPSAMAAMKAYAQELLVAQGDPHGLLDAAAGANGTAAQPPAAPTPFDQTAASQAGDTPPGLPPLQMPQEGVAGTPTFAMATDGSVTPCTAARMDVGQLPLGVKQAAVAALASKQHFELPPTLQPKRPSTESDVAPRAAAAGTGGAAGSAAAHTPLRPHPHLRTSIGWICSNSPSSGETVLEHRVAGDLHVPNMATKQRGRLAGPGGGGSSAASPTRDLRRRPLLRASQQSGGGPPSPSPKGGAAPGQKRGGGTAATSPSKKAGSDDGEGDDLDSLDFEAREKPFWKKKTFWLIAGPLTVSAAFLLAAILYITLSPSDTLGQFQIWRLCFFIAGLPIIWWIGRGSMNIAVWGVEKTMFTWQNALYYVYAVRRPMSNVIRAGLATGWWALMMTSFSSNMNSDLVKAYNIVLKLLGCLTLFMTANLLKVLFAKMMASSFNRASHYQKMHDALKREYLLHLLLQPRRRYADFAEEEEEGCDDLDGDGGDGGDMHRSKSAPSDLVHRQLTRVSTLQRLFRPSMNRGLSRHELDAPLEPPVRRSFKERVMFWRRSKAELQPIEEADEKEGQADALELHNLGSGSTTGGLPPGTVVVDVEGGGRGSTAGGSVGGSAPSRVPSIAADIPLLEHSPPSIAVKPPPHKMTPPPSPSPATTPVARPAGLMSQASLPTGKPPLPAPSPRPPTKLERLRSQALEAARDEVLGKPGQGHGAGAGAGARGSAGSEVASLGRRFSGESERGAAMRRPSLGRDWRTPEGTMHGPGSTVHGGAGGTMHGSGSVGGTVHAGVAVGMASREASAAGGATARVTFARAAPIKRSTSLQSHKSLAAGKAAVPAPAVDPLAKKPVLQHANSISSSQPSKQLQMALKLNKMEKYIRKHALEVTFRDALSRVERNEKVTTELEAKRLSFYLFYNVKADFDRDHLILEDLEELLPSEKDAKSAMDMLDEDGNGKVTVQECCAAITKMFVDRRNLAATLKDTRSIVGKLETVIGVVLHIFMFFLYLIIFNVDVMKTWAGFASLFLGFSFIFGNSIRTTYESVIFLFLAHPYDVGDALLLDSEQVKVEEIHLSMTVMMNGTNGRLYYPNEKLRLIPFVNITRSGNKGESFKVLVDINTPGITSVMEALRAAGDAVIKAAPTEFSNVMAVNLKEGGSPLKMMITVYWEFAHTGMDAGRTARGRTRMIAQLTEALQKSGVRYTWPALEGMPLGHSSAAAAFAGVAAGESAGADPSLKLL